MDKNLGKLPLFYSDAFSYTILNSINTNYSTNFSGGGSD